MDERWDYSSEPLKFRLMIRARFFAALHCLWNIRQLGKHRIWRLYRAWGFQTFRVFCDCGKEFK